MNKRNKVMLDFCVKRWDLLTPENRSNLYIVPSERGPRYCLHIEPNRIGTIVPKGKWVVVGSEIGRIGLMAPEEMWCGQQLPMCDYQRSKTDFDLCRCRLSYSALVKFAGNAFHSSSAGCFMLSTLLLPRFSNLLRRRS